MKEGRFKKAVIQLCKNIQRCINKEFTLDTNYDVNELRIFPIIIVHDSLYSAAGLNYWIYYWLKDEINLLKSDERLKKFDFNKIMPLTVIEIDTLILYKKYFIENKLDLPLLIKSYHDFVQFEFKGQSISEVEQHATKSAIPFSEFIRRKGYELGLEIEFESIRGMLKEYNIN